MGSQLWINKIQDIHDTVLDKTPDIVIVSEANILLQDQDHKIHVPGYSIILPNTMSLLGNCRIAVLIREGMNVQVLDKGS